MRSKNAGISVNETKSVFIVAASDVVRAGLESLVAHDPRFTIAGSAAGLSELAAQVAEGVTPDVVIYDAERQGQESLAALRSFLDESDEDGGAPTFLLIGAEGSDWLRGFLRGGLVRAALPSVASGAEIIAAIEAIAAGLVALDVQTLAALFPPAASSVDDLSIAAPPGERSPTDELMLDALTARERGVLEMLAEGLSNKEIAGRMKISEHTVKFHVASIFAKLHVTTRTEAVMRGVRQGLIMM